MISKIRPIRIDGNIAFVPLSQGYEAVIDTADAPLVGNFNWTAKISHRTVYAHRKTQLNGVQRVFLLHRVLAGEPSGMQVDHIDNDGLNNRRENLRIVTHQQNTQNSRARVNNSSGFKGVSLDKKSRKWLAQIQSDKKKRNLGLFETPEDAHAAYVSASRELHGLFGRCK